MTAFSLESEWQGLYYPTITKTPRILKNVLSTLLNMQYSRMNSSQQQCEAGPLMSRFTAEGAEAWDTDNPGHRAPGGGAETPRPPTPPSPAPATAAASLEGLCLMPSGVTLDQQHGRPLGPTPDLRWDAEICILVNPRGIVVHT